MREVTHFTYFYTVKIYLKDWLFIYLLSQMVLYKMAEPLCRLVGKRQKNQQGDARKLMMMEGRKY